MMQVGKHSLRVGVRRRLNALRQRSAAAAVIAVLAAGLATVVTAVVLDQVGAAPDCPVAGTTNWSQIDLDPSSAGCTLTLPGDIAYFNKNTSYDADSVANTSTIDVSIPPGATVVAAMLLWGGGSKWATNQAQLDAQTINFGPAGGPLANYNGTTAGAIAGNNGAYFKLADITSFMQDQFATDQNINNDPDHGGTASFEADGWRCATMYLGPYDCGWQIAVVWALPEAPLRSVAFYFGGDFTFGYNPQVYFEVDSLLLPPATTPDVRLYHTAHDADGPRLSYGGGRTSMKIGMQSDTSTTPGQGQVACPRNPQGFAPPAMYQDLTDPTPPADWAHVRLSEYENAGTAVGTTPSYPNGSPVLSDLCVNLDGQYLNWDWSSTFAISAKVFEPAFEGSEKTVANCGGDPAATTCVPMADAASAHAAPGDVLEYTISVENAGPARGGPDGPVDDAEDVFIRDVAPSGLTYVPNSIKIDNDGDGVFESSPTDGPLDDQAEAGTISDPAIGTVTGLTARLGTGAGSSSDRICYNGFVPSTYPDPYPLEPAKAGQPVPLGACGGGRMTPGAKSSVKFRVAIPGDGTIPQELNTDGAMLPGIILDNDFQVAAVARTPKSRIFRRFSDFDPQSTVGTVADQNLGVVIDGLTNVRVQKESEITPDPEFATPSAAENADQYIAGNLVVWTITLDNDDSTPPDVGTTVAGSPSPSPEITFRDTLPSSAVIDYGSITWSCAVADPGVEYLDQDATVAGVQSLPTGYPDVDFATSCGSIPDAPTPVTPVGADLVGNGVRLASTGKVTILVRARIASDVPVGSGQLANQAAAALGNYTTKAGYEQPDSSETGAGLADNVDTETDDVVRAGDLVVTKGDDKSATPYITPSPISPVIAGNQITYEIRVKNPVLLPGAAGGNNPDLQTTNVDGSPLRPATMHPNVIEQLPGDLLTTPAPVWSCTATGTGTSCGAASGTGVLNDTPTIAAAGEVVYRVTATVNPGAADVSNAELQNRVSLTLPNGEIDLDSTNNSAIDVDDLVKVTDLSITKDDGTTQVTPGGTTLTYVIEVRNDGSSTASGVAITDAIPSDVANPTWTCTPIGAGLCAAVSGSGNVATSATLPMASGVRILVAGTVNPAATGSGTKAGGAACPAGTFELCNTARILVPADSSDVDLADNEATDVDQILPSFDLAVAKTRVGPLIPGNAVQYQVSVTNNGPSTASGFSIEDALPGGLMLNGVSGSGWDCGDTSGNTAACTYPGALAPTGTASVTVFATATADMAIEPVTNGVDLFHPTDTNPANNHAEDTTTPQPSADLSIVKEQLEPIVAGRPVVYRLTITNNGPSAAAGVFLEDALPAGLTYSSFVSVSPGWTCAADAPVRCDLGPDLMPGAGAATVVEIEALAGATATGDLTNTASVAASTGDPDQANNLTSVTGPTELQADLIMAKNPVGEAVAGGSTSYELVVTNDGPSQASDLVVTDPTPAGLTFQSAAGDGWACAEAPVGTLRCTRSSLDPGAGPPITVTYGIAAGLTGDIVNRAAVASSTPDGGAGNNQATSTRPVTFDNDVAVTKTSTGVLVAGQAYAWTVQVTNPGPSTARNVSVSDTLPAGAIPRSAGGTGAVCEIAAQAVSCELASLDPGAQVTITVLADIDPSLTDPITNSVSVDAADDRSPTNDAAADGPLAPTASADLSIGKTHQPLLAGTAGEWTIVVTNLGPSTSTGFSVSDLLPDSVSLTSISGTGFVCGASQTAPSCEFTGSLRPGEQATVSLMGEIDADAEGELVNQAEVAAVTPDPIPSNNLVSDSAQLKVESVVAVSAVALTEGPVRLGDTVTWAAKYQNLGTTTTGDAKMTIELSEGQRISDIRIASHGVALDGSASVWTGEWVCTQLDSKVTCTAADFPPGYEAAFEIDSLVTSEEVATLSATALGTAAKATGDSNATASIAVEKTPPEPTTTTTTTAPAPTTAPTTSGPPAPGPTVTTAAVQLPTTTTVTPTTVVVTTAPAATVQAATVTTQKAQVAGASQVFSAATGANPSAKTGADIGWLVWLGGLLLVGGAALFLLGRRRRNPEDEAAI